MRSYLPIALEHVGICQFLQYNLRIVPLFVLFCLHFVCRQGLITMLACAYLPALCVFPLGLEGLVCYSVNHRFP